MSKKDVTLKDGWVQKIKGQILKPLVDIIPNALRKKLTVQTEVKGAEKVEEAKRKLESLPKTKTGLRKRSSVRLRLSNACTACWWAN